MISNLKIFLSKHFVVLLLKVGRAEKVDESKALSLNREKITDNGTLP